MDLNMAHHLDSPIARQDIRLDITDLFVFRGEVGTVFIINVCHSIFGQIPTPGFHPEGMYEFKIDINDDAVEEITYRFKFEELDSSGRQRFHVTEVTGPDAPDQMAMGTALLSGTTGALGQDAGGLRVWAGKAYDPFWIEPDVLHAVGHAFQDGTPIELGDWDPSKAKNLFDGHTVYSLVLEVRDSRLLSLAQTGQRVGVWAVATLATDAGGWRSINRIGLPMIHPLFTQYNEDLGNRLNAGKPSEDFNIYGSQVAKAVARVVRATGTSDDPEGYGTLVAHRLFPNMLPYKLGSKATFGFAEWNGRSLIDNAPDVMFSFAANAPVRLGIGRDSVSNKPSHAFPYVHAIA